MHRGLSRVTARLFIPYAYYWTILNENWTCLWSLLITINIKGASEMTCLFLSPKCIDIYNELNIGLALYCVIEIVNVELSDWWSWKRHTGRFYFIPIFNLTEYRLESWRCPFNEHYFVVVVIEWHNLLMVTVPWIRVAVWRFPKWERTYWEVFSMHFRNYPHIQKVRIEKWLM